ncbi:MAG: polysaccharide biosynthesis protein [Clostridia bacterium]|nr:polysaccharide biosynthesis protein [Clostridia bacterium]
MKKNKFVEGTIFAYAMILITKVIGALYVIPFYKIIGTSGGVLYSYAYSVYNFFLDISTSGVPTAVSIIIAEYNSLKMFNEREYAFKVANKLVTVISFIAFLVMFLFAEPLARFFIKDIQADVSIASIVLVIRVISFCLLIIPFLSVLRGYLQGNKFVSASSSSQLIEQLVRVFIALVGSYVAINVLQLNIPTGVSIALSGTVLGGLAAYLFLRGKIRRNKEQFEEGVTSPEDSTVTAKEIMKKIISRAVPVIIIAATQNIYGMIDLKLIIKGLHMIGYDADTCQLLGSIVVTWAPKICMIINSIAISMCLSIIPFIVNSYVQNEKKELNKKFNQAVNTILYISIPLAFFIYAFGKQIYFIFYGSSPYGGNVLALNALVSVFFCLQMVMDMILQGMKNYDIVYMNTVVGLAINAVLDVPMILLLNHWGLNPYLGSMVATLIGLIVSIGIIMIGIKKRFGFNYNSIVRNLIKILFAVIIMTVLIVVLKLVMPATTTFMSTFMILALFGVLAIGLYVFITYKMGTMNDILGEDFIEKIVSKFKPKKI